MLILKMAWRNIGRNRRRTVVTVGAMALGLYAMVIWFGMLQGLLNDMEETVVEVELGDLQIHAPTYLDDPSLYTDIEDFEALLARLEAAGFRASARLVGAGLAAAHDSAAGASLRGIDVQGNARVSVISTRLAAGEWLDDGDPAGVVVGRRLARALDLAVGDELVVLSQTTDGAIANDLYLVRGILESVSDGVDRSAVFLTDAAFRELFFMPAGAHEVVVRKPDDLELAAALETVQGLAPGLDTRSWRSLVPTIATYLDSARAAMGIVSAVVYIVIAILILNAMLMAVFERIREFGVLKALGVEPRQVLSLIFVESALQTGLALAIGLALSLPTLWYLVEFGIDTGALGGVSVIGATFATVWRAAVSPVTFATPALTLILLVLAAVIYPALKAARISPVEAMRHQ
ncbi:MAG: ABC transporter permease [Acidobacteriota bacterium]|nr:ABC transporter permease [Acidobacteriota bacterium]